jgi:thymidylate synthase
VINPAETSISKLTAQSKGFTVTWKKKTTQITGYQLQYSTSKNFSGVTTKTITKNTTTKAAFKGLKEKKTYYVRIRTYKTVSGTKYYSAWSTAKTVTTKK